MKTIIYAWRFLVRLKSYTIINIVGLSLSLACCIILLRYINSELSVDDNCVDKDSVYGVKFVLDGVTYGLSIAELDGLDSMYVDKRYISERAQLTILEQDYVEYEGERYIMNGIVADNEFFKIFRYEPAQGSLSLDAPDAALLTEDFAARIFGSENPIGKKIRYSNGKDLIVSGILKKKTLQENH